ncbi:MAG TPA: type II secretion system protein GspG [Candidatus Udaeobacter sp.]|nr:type II secretion system protein GspG [Candidatus Udaeobacter sp.]
MTGFAEMTKQSVIRYIVTSVQRIYGATTQRFNDLTWRSRSSLSVTGAFTLIELIVVVTVIVILTGLVLSTVGYVQKKAARSRAETEIAAMSAALESYKADNGTYPRNSDTDGLNAQITGNPNTSQYQRASLYLYNALFGATNGSRTPDTGAKSYFVFKPNMLSPDDQTQNVQFIRDPFANSYGYSTIQAATGNTSAGYNPTFDLWSTAGLTSGTDSTQWIKNW